MGSFVASLVEIRRRIEQQTADLRSGKFQLFAFNDGAPRAETNCNAEMITALEDQLKDLDGAIEYAKSVPVK